MEERKKDKYPRCIPRYQHSLHYPLGYPKSLSTTEPPPDFYISPLSKHKKHFHLLPTMRFTLIAAISILSTLASGLALPDLTPRSLVIRPEIGVVIKEDFPTTSFPAAPAEVSRRNGAHNVKTLLCFVVPPCSGKCTISFSDALTATGSRRLQLFSLGGCAAGGNTWISKPYTDVHKATFLVSGPGLAVVVEDFGLTFDCPVTTTKYGFELQPVWDDDSVTWDISKGGLIITCG